MPRNGCDETACGGGGDNGNGAGSDNGVSDGCIYPDEVIMEKGVAFNVRYTGCVEVKTSMKSLDFSTRTQVARECINRVCEAAGLKSAGKRRVDKKIAQFISDRPCMDNAGTNVIINVSSRSLHLLNVETGDMIANHNMPRISFASGGDSDTLDFLAYIAKNEDEWRACYVLECIGGQSEDLIVTIGKAFMLRYNALSRKTHQPQENYNTGKENEKDYYNDLPNKLPPDLLTEDDELIQQKKQQQQHQQHLHTHSHSHQHHQHHHHHHQQQQQSQQQQLPQQKVCQLNLKKSRDRFSSNLIDLNSPPPDQTIKMNLTNFDSIKSECTTGAVAALHTHCHLTGHNQQNQPVRDVFDIQPFSLSAEVQRSQLMTEPWFHAAVSRPIAEHLLKSDGDFLVRESQGKPGQYVLTGLEGKTPKHLLLIDPEGVVRTKDRIFDSISHLINYHWTNSLPIISEETELVLRNPVLKQQQTATTTTTTTITTTPSSSSSTIATT